jgi:hypothetical protein
MLDFAACREVWPCDVPFVLPWTDITVPVHGNTALLPAFASHLGEDPFP